MEGWKMTLPFRDSTVIECAVRAALEVSSRVILVTGYRGAETAALFAAWQGVEVAENPGYALGMFSSLRVGAGRVRTGRAFIALGDMPLVGPEIYRALLEAPPLEVVVPSFKGKKGHPLLVGSRVIGGILAAPGSSTLREVLGEFPILCLPVACASVVHDIDSPEDYQELFNDQERSMR